VRTGECEAGAGMVEGCVHPVRGVVTGIASLREVCRHVIRIGRTLIVLQVASYTRGAVQAVVVVDVAVGAGSRWYRVQTGERETGAGVVKRRVHPVGGVVTGIASLREVRCDVIRIGRALIVLEVACDARRAVQAVVVVDVTIGAGSRRNGVHSGERETGAGVVKRRIKPGAGAVALLAGLGEVRRHVIRIGRTLIVREVAADASPGA